MKIKIVWVVFFWMIVYGSAYAKERMALEYKKPVLVVHGDTNAYCFNQQSKAIPNLWHFNGPGDFKVSDAARIVFDPNNNKEPFEIRGVLNPVKPPLECNYNHGK